MTLIKLLLTAITFLIGFLSAMMVFYVASSGVELPLADTLGLVYPSSNQTPSNYINEHDIELHNDKLIIHIDNPSLGRYAPTGSMEPVLDENSNGIRIVPKSTNEISEGDIITFRQDGYLVIHRVVKKARDSQGIYFITKGDNNAVSDKKIRFVDIRYKTIGILY